MTPNIVRKTFVSGLAGLAMVAGSIAIPGQANASHKTIPYFVGGLALGAVLAHSAGPRYGYPTYRNYHRRHAVRYYRPCHWEQQKSWNPYYGWTWHKVKVCW